MKGKKCGKGWISNAKKCIGMGTSLSSSKGGSGGGNRAVPRSSGKTVRSRGGPSKKAIAGGAVAAAGAFLAVSIARDMKPMAVGIAHVGAEGWINGFPPGKPFVNEKGVVQFPEVEGYRYMKKGLVEETGDPTVYPFAAGRFGAVFKSKEDDSAVIKVPKGTQGRMNARKTAEAEWDNLQKAKDSGVTPKPISFYKKSKAIKMENLFNPLREGGIPVPLKDGLGKVKSPQVIDGFARLHNAGVVHGDAHLQNVMIQENGKLLFADLGGAGLEGQWAAHNDVERAISYAMMSDSSYIKRMAREKLRGNESREVFLMDAMLKFRDSGPSKKAYGEYVARLNQIYEKE